MTNTPKLDTKFDIWYSNRDPIAELLNQQDKRIKELEKENQQLKQLQKQLAIEELKKAKFICQTRIAFVDDEQEQKLCDYIDNQIKELKEEKYK